MIFDDVRPLSNILKKEKMIKWIQNCSSAYEET